MIKPSYWTPDKLGVVMHLWEERWTAVEIADALNAQFPGHTITKNAVISKVARMGLPMHRPGWRHGGGTWRLA